ncbi:unnamed protein product [Urochloa humidicola]
MDPNIHDEVLCEVVPVVHAAKRGWIKVVEILLPRTNEIAGLPTSVDGLMEHVGSKEFKLMDQGQRETRIANQRTRFLQELRNRHFLGANYMLRVLNLEGAKVEFLENLYLILLRTAIASKYLDCNDESIRSYGFLASKLRDHESALQAAKGCMALDRNNESNRTFYLTMIRKTSEASTSH